jgi:hypothetical protein
LDQVLIACFDISLGNRDLTEKRNRKMFIFKLFLNVCFDHF